VLSLKITKATAISNFNSPCESYKNDVTGKDVSQETCKSKGGDLCSIMNKEYPKIMANNLLVKRENTQELVLSPVTHSDAPKMKKVVEYDTKEEKTTSNIGNMVEEQKSKLCHNHDDSDADSSVIEPISINLNTRDKKTKFTRWGRKDDRNSYSVFRRMLQEQSLTIDYIYDINNEDKFQEIIQKVADECGWRRDLDFLENRFRKLHSLPRFSVREMKLMRRLKKTQKKKANIDWEEFLYHFPGKTHQLLYDAFNVDNTLSGC